MRSVLDIPHLHFSVLRDIFSFRYSLIKYYLILPSKQQSTATIGWQQWSGRVSTRDKPPTTPQAGRASGHRQCSVPSRCRRHSMVRASLQLRLLVALVLAVACVAWPQTVLALDLSRLYGHMSAKRNSKCLKARPWALLLTRIDRPPRTPCHTPPPPLTAIAQYISVWLTVTHWFTAFYRISLHHLHLNFLHRFEKCCQAIR